MEQMDVMKAQIRLRCDTELNWKTQNPTLAKGEPGVIIGGDNHGKMKVGDGDTEWNDLKLITHNTVFTGIPRVPIKTIAASTNGTLIATEAQVALKANIISPAFAGTPTAPEIAAANIPRLTTSNVQTGPSALNNWGTQIVSMNTLRNAFLQANFPVNSYYTQYPIRNQSTILGMFPPSESPATLFGGTWTLQYESENVFFRTGNSPGTGNTPGNRRGAVWNNGSKAFTTAATDGAMPGVEPDAIRNITGSTITIRAEHSAGADSGALRSYGSGFGNGGGSWTARGFHFNASWNVPTDNSNRPKNRLIKVWKRTG